MLKEALEYLIGLGKTSVQEVDGRMYADRPMHTVAPPLDASVTVATLTGFVDLLTSKVNDLSPETCFIHVESPGAVSLYERGCSEWGRRQAHVLAHLPSHIGCFPFGGFQEQEAFIIGVLAHFVESQDLDYVLRVASNLKAELVNVSDDDGISQRAAMKVGVVLAEATVVKRRVLLAPRRTFLEVPQPASEFIFRLRSRNGEAPTLALFEADGGAWRSTAMQSIKAWLEGKAIGLPIVA